MRRGKGDIVIEGVNYILRQRHSVAKDKLIIVDNSDFVIGSYTAKFYINFKVNSYQQGSRKWRRYIYGENLTKRSGIKGSVFVDSLNDISRASIINWLSKPGSQVLISNKRISGVHPDFIAKSNSEAAMWKEDFDKFNYFLESVDPYVVDDHICPMKNMCGLLSSTDDGDIFSSNHGFNSRDITWNVFFCNHNMKGLDYSYSNVRNSQSMYVRLMNVIIRNKNPVHIPSAYFRAAAMVEVYPELKRRGRTFLVAPSGSGKTTWAKENPRYVDLDTIFEWPDVSHWWKDPALAEKVNSNNRNILEKWLSQPGNEIGMYAEDLGLGADYYVLVPEGEHRKRMASKDRPDQPSDFSEVVHGRKVISEKDYYDDFDQLDKHLRS
jgi:hypothetical protein